MYFFIIHKYLVVKFLLNAYLTFSTLQKSLKKLGKKVRPKLQNQT